MCLIALLLTIAAVPYDCGPMTAPGQVDYVGTMVVLNRTVDEVTLSSGTRTIAVPPCGEATATDFPLNWWNLTSPGRDSFHSGGGFQAATAFLTVTAIVDQTASPPDPFPPCAGRLQPASE